MPRSVSRRAFNNNAFKHPVGSGRQRSSGSRNVHRTSAVGRGLFQTNTRTSRQAPVFLKQKKVYHGRRKHFVGGARVYTFGGKPKGVSFRHFFFHRPRVVFSTFRTRYITPVTDKACATVAMVSALSALLFSTVTCCVGILLIPTPVGLTMTLVGGLATLVFLSAFESSCRYFADSF